jgi:ribonuclease HII
MRGCSVDLPHWGFEKHVGYGTADHLAAIKSHGICHLHRKNFAPIRDML